MKLTKSILSPARANRDPSHLSSSLSRRNGSLKGGASPFFTTKKRGCGGGGAAFENPEPSSPKVTCIGQVRVKTKKKVRQQTRSLSRRTSGSFRKTDSDLASVHSRSSGYQNHKPVECFPHRSSSSRSSGGNNNNSNSQKWAYFPSICEGFSCLFPCSKTTTTTTPSYSSSSCCFSSKCGEERRDSCVDQNGCGAVFTRWFVSVNDGEKRREIELVVGGGDEHGEEEEERSRMSMRSSRRHVFEDILVKDDKVIQINNNNNDDEYNDASFFEDEEDKEEPEEEKGRVSICIPPKNALLLMRCRSDPTKVAALASRFSWDANGVNHDDDEEEEQGKEKLAARYSVDGFGRAFQQEQVKDEIFDSLVKSRNEMMMTMKSTEADEASLVEANEMMMKSTEAEEDAGLVEANEMMMAPIEAGEAGLFEANEMMMMAPIEMGLEEEGNDDELRNETFVEQGEGEEEEVESNMSSFEALLDQENAAAPPEEEVESAQEQVAEISTSPIYQSSSSSSSSSTESDSEHEEDESEAATLDSDKLSSIQGFGNNPEKESPPVLPDCLLLMMCEPKLSMEVSKETWVCSTDFIRWLPNRPPKKSSTKTGGCNHKKPDSNKPKLVEKIDNPPPLPPPPPVQPRRSSCSLPPKGPSMAVQIEQKLVNSAAYEPLVLTRCKSEPMRSAAAKLMPDSFYWKNAIRKLEEPHRRATVGAAAAAGVGC